MSGVVISLAERLQEGHAFVTRTRCEIAEATTQAELDAVYRSLLNAPAGSCEWSIVELDADLARKRRALARAGSPPPGGFAA